MLDRLVVLIPTLTLLGFAAGPLQASEWIGRWGNPNCAADATIIGLSTKELDLSTFEATCRVSSSKSGPRGHELRATCRGEGSPTRVAFVVTVSGDTLTFVSQSGIQFDPKRYTRCGR